MYQYFFCITTAKEIKGLRETYSSDIIEAIKSFNESSQLARTYKRILEETVNIFDDKFEFVLETKENLGDFISLRYLHLLSKFLLDIDGLNKYSINKRFLKPLEIKRLQGLDLEKKEFSDKQVLKYIIDLYFDNSKSKKKKDVRDKIKRLVCEYIEQEQLV